MSDMDLDLHTDGPVLEFPEDTWRTDPEEMSKWLRRIRDAVSAQDPWALLGQRPDCDVFVFSCTTHGIWECALWSTRVRLMFAPGQRWDDWESPATSQGEGV